MIQRGMPCRRTGIGVGSALFLIPHLTSVFLNFPTCHLLFSIEICEACLILRGHSFWFRRVLTMTPICASLSLWEVLFLLGVLPILSGCLETLKLHTTARPILPSSDPSFYCAYFFLRVAVWEVYRLSLLQILPALWIFYFSVGFFFF